MKNEKNVKEFVTGDIIKTIFLLTIVAVVVVFFVEPSEWANKFRDKNYKYYSVKLLRYIDLYDTAKGGYPWVTEYPKMYPANYSAFGFHNAAEKVVGICSEKCPDAGVITSIFDKSKDLLHKNFILKNLSYSDSIYVGKEEGTNSRVHACFIPLSRELRTKSCKEGKVYTIDSFSGKRTPILPETCYNYDKWFIRIPYDSWMVCVP